MTVTTADEFHRDADAAAPDRRTERDAEPLDATHDQPTPPPPQEFHPLRGHLPTRLSLEPAWQRLLGLAVAVAVTIGFYLATQVYWTAAHPGVDQNGYLFGGRQIAHTLTMKVAPTLPGGTAFDPHFFVGRMWVGFDYGTDAERYYPKYPIGLPVLYAVSLWIGGDTLGPIIAYQISPVAMTLALLATFLLIRRVAGTFAGLLGMLVLAASPTTLHLTNNPNSHASTLLCVAAGMLLLVRWWQRGGWASGLFAGLLIGYAATIRYTEATLLLPILWVIGCRLWDADRRALVTFVHVGGVVVAMLIAASALGRTEAGSTRTTLLVVAATLAIASVAGVVFHLLRLVRDGITRERLALWRDATLVLLGWAVPVAALLSYNLVAMGTLTGYDPTNESTGFRWEFFWDNWETVVRHLGTNGISLLLPVSLVGLVAMFFWNLRLAVFTALWALPCLAIYAFYYWAPDGSLVGYLRFFLTIFPALLIASTWLIAETARFFAHHPDAGPSALEPAYRWSAWKLAVVIGVGVAALLLADPAVRVNVRPISLTPRDVYFEDPLVHQNLLRLDRYGGHYAMMAGVGAFAAAIAAALFVRRRAAVPLAAGLLGLLTVNSLVQGGLPALETESYNRLVLDRNAQQVLKVVPEDAVFFCGDQGMLHHLQFLRDLHTYHGETFNKGFINSLDPANPNFVAEDPQGWDPGRRAGLFERLKAFDQNALDEQARQIIDSATRSNRRVFVAVSRAENDGRRRLERGKPPGLPEPWRRVLDPKRFDLVESAIWLHKPPFEVERVRRQQPRLVRDPRGQFRPVAWAIYEIKPKPPA
jgi:hypothetical protein